MSLLYHYAVLVTIVVLVILAGITLNAVIGEDGIIFQAKDTKNMITNETEYDNEQLAALQNELKDNDLYSGIGIIPGTDTGGSSEGGESGLGGSGNQGGSNSGGTNTNTGGSDGGMIGGDAVPPTITVLEGEEIAASFFRSDVTIQIATTDKTLRIKYILTTTVDEINNELYPSGLIKEIDIENGGTLTFTKDGEYTITAYSYDLEGKKSNSTIMWLKRETGTTAGSGVTVSVASGNMGQNDWYTSNITLRVLGTDTGSSRVTYRVRGTAYSTGTIGNTEYQAGEVDTGEVDIANGTTFRIAIDGEFAIVAYTYDSGGMRLSTAPTLNVRRDASRPIVTLYKGEQVIGEGFRISMAADDYASGLATEGRYTYRHKLAPNMTYTDNLSQETTYLYTGLEADKTYDMYMIVKDEAGNMTASDVISRPAVWISNTPTVGDTVSGGVEGARKYCSTDVDVSLTGQDENNVDISRVTYQILGTTTGAGNMDGTYYDKGVALSEDEIEMANGKTIQIQADGNWTIKIHTYNKENVRVTTNTLEVTRDTVTPEPPVIEVVSGTMGEETYYRSDITVRLSSQDDTCYKKTTYTVTGTATGNGTIGGVSITSGQQVNITETDIANGGTFVIAADGRWTVKGYTYDKAGRKSETAEGIVVTRDVVAPTITNLTTNAIANTNTSYTSGNPVTVTATCDFGVSGQATGGGYFYYLNDDFVKQSETNSNSFDFVANKTYVMKVTTKDKAGNTAENTITGYTYIYLVDKVALGDYVAYDAGTWSSTVAMPTTQGSLGGYTAGNNKGTSVTGNTSGWRVLSKSGSGSTGTVTLISAGSPVSAYKAGNSSSNMNRLVTALNNFASNNYLNATYASSARNMNTGDYSNANSAGVLNIGAQYWLANSHQVQSYSFSGSSYTGYRYYYYTDDGTYSGSSIRRKYYDGRSSGTTYYGVYSINSSGSYYYQTTTNTSGSYKGTSSRRLQIWSGRVSNSEPDGSRLYNSSSGTLYYSSSTSVSQYGSATYGTRPVVVLKTGIKTNVSKDQTYLDQTCWNLEI